MPENNNEISEVYEKLKEYQAQVNSFQFGFGSDFKSKYLELVSAIYGHSIDSSINSGRLINLDQRAKDLDIREFQGFILLLDAEIGICEMQNRYPDGSVPALPERKLNFMKELKEYLETVLSALNPTYGHTRAIYHALGATPPSPAPVATQNHEHSASQEKIHQAAIENIRTNFKGDDPNTPSRLRQLYSGLKGKIRWRDEEFRASRGLDKIKVLLTKAIPQGEEAGVIQKINNIAGAYMGGRHREADFRDLAAQLKDNNRIPNQAKIANIYIAANIALTRVVTPSKNLNSNRQSNENNDHSSNNRLRMK